MTALEGPSEETEVSDCRARTKRRNCTIDLHQLLVIHFLFLLIVESLIELVGLRLDILLLLIGFGVTDVITKSNKLVR